MSYTSVFVIANGVSGPSPGAIADCVAELSERKIERIDLVISRNTQYYFLHLNGIMANQFYTVLSTGQRNYETAQGGIRIGLDRSGGLDPATLDTVFQYKITSAGTFCRNFKNPAEVNRWHETAMTWVPSAENPFLVEIQDVDMDDAFYSADEGETTPRKPAKVTSEEATFAPLKDMEKREMKTTEELHALRETLFA